MALIRWEPVAELNTIQNEMNRLFNNFFDQPAVAVREMLRVAKPGAALLVSDETKKIVTKSYQRSIFTRAYFKDAKTDFDPRSWVPEGVADLKYEEVWDGKGYILTFRA